MALTAYTPAVRQSFDVLVVRYASLDAWIACQSDPKPTRPEAIRCALEAVMWLGGLDHEKQ